MLGGDDFDVVCLFVCLLLWFVIYFCENFLLRSVQTK